MPVFLTVLLFIVGLVLIVKGGDFFVDAATWIAEATGIPHFIIGATIVSLATTLPEIIVSSIAAMQGKVDMAIGNAVGSVTANTGLIMGLSVLFIPAVIKRAKFIPKAVLMLLATAALLLLTFKTGSLGPIGAIVMFVIFAVFIYENIASARGEMGAADKPPVDKKQTFPNILKFVGGAAAIVLGADLLVDNGSALATLMGAPESLVALTFVAIGTSLPELVTAITAIRKKQSSLSVGNIIGANIIDMTLILPICSLISGGTLPVSAQTYTLDLPVCLLIMLIAMAPTMIRGKFSRWQGALTMVLYIGYMVLLAVIA